MQTNQGECKCGTTVRGINDSMSQCLLTYTNIPTICQHTRFTLGQDNASHVEWHSLCVKHIVILGRVVYEYRYCNPLTAFMGNAHIWHFDSTYHVLFPNQTVSACLLHDELFSLAGRHEMLACSFHVVILVANSLEPHLLVSYHLLVCSTCLALGQSWTVS